MGISFSPVAKSITASISNALSASVTNIPQVHPIANTFVTSATNSFSAITVNSPVSAGSGAISGITLGGGILGIQIYVSTAMRVSENSGDGTSFTRYFTVPSGIVMAVDVKNMTDLFFLADNANSNLHFILYS